MIEEATTETPPEADASEEPFHKVVKLPVCITLRMKFAHRVKNIAILVKDAYGLEDIYVDTFTSAKIPEIWGRMDYKKLDTLRRLNEVSMVTEEEKVFTGIVKEKKAPPTEDQAE